MAAQPSQLAYATSPADNPLRGLVPYQGNHPSFPHSMEFNYVALRELVRQPGVYDWAPLDRLLNDVASRGHQTIFRVFVEYPDQPSGVPDYLVKGGLRIHQYTADNAKMLTPNYEDPKLRACLRDFVAALGRRYDGDPRIGYITAGLLGHWGEWHNYPRDELFASVQVQKEILDAYTRAFRRTPVLLRYPRNASDPRQAANAALPFGYHDDSFAWATLDTGRPEDSWFFMAALRQAGPAAQKKWQRHPIGGEIRPEAWGRVFDEVPGLPQIQDFAQCVEATHVTWLMDSGMFREDVPAERFDRAIRAVQRMGYELHVPRFTSTASSSGLRVEFDLENRGVAPFYAQWDSQIGLLDERGRLVRVHAFRRDYRDILPAVRKRLRAVIRTARLNPGPYRVLFRILNPLPNGRPLRFANRTQDADRAGWLSLGSVLLKPNRNPVR